MVSRSLPRRTLRPGLTASCPPFDTVRFGPGSAVASIHHPSILAVSRLAPQAPPRLARLRPVQFRRPLTHATSETRPGSRRRGLGLAVPRDCTSHKSRAFWPDCAASSRVGKQTNGQAHTSRTVRRDRTVDFSMAKNTRPAPRPGWRSRSPSACRRDRVPPRRARAAHCTVERPRQWTSSPRQHPMLLLLLRCCWSVNGRFSPLRRLVSSRLQLHLCCCELLL